MQQYRLTIAYDGTNYRGWQVQKDSCSIAEKLQEAFRLTFNKKVYLAGVSRTDSGVHALGQVASFRTDLNLDPKSIQSAWNNRLSPDVVIRLLHRIDDNYNIHRLVKTKQYYYHFFIKRPLPFIQRYGWYINQKIDLEKLKKTLTIFIGTHDFKLFSTGDDRGCNTIRTINTITLSYVKRINAYRIAIEGPLFLRHMVRRMVGASLAVAMRPELKISSLQEMLRNKNSKTSLPTAPAQGLLLYKIIYNR